jgi:uncharacterized protein (TIGR02145 family)
MSHFKTFSFAALLMAAVVSCGKPEETPIPSNDDDATLTLSHASTTRMRGAEFTLTATGTTGAITWSSSNTAVATVDATTGVIKALTSGTSTITATAGTLTAECALTVEVSCATESNLTAGIGTASFISDKTWTVAGRIWSDDVTATGCQKTTYLGDPNSGAYRSDCRSNPGYGDLFSWCAIIRYQDVLCPDGWRIPTKEEFITLDKEFGFIGGYFEPDWAKVEATYLGADKWGAKLGGYCLDKETMGMPGGTLLSQDKTAAWWASDENTTGKGNGFCLYLSKGGDFPPTIDINYMSMFDQGQSLRCIKTL